MALSRGSTIEYKLVEISPLCDWRRKSNQNSFNASEFWHKGRLRGMWPWVSDWQVTRTQSHCQSLTLSRLTDDSHSTHSHTQWLTVTLSHRQSLCQSISVCHCRSVSAVPVTLNGYTHSVTVHRFNYNLFQWSIVESSSQSSPRSQDSPSQSVSQSRSRSDCGCECEPTRICNCNCKWATDSANVTHSPVESATSTITHYSVSDSVTGRDDLTPLVLACECEQRWKYWNWIQLSLLVTCSILWNKDGND